MKKKQFEYRMYGFVIYSLSGIQKGIQFGHATKQYEIGCSKDKDYQRWLIHDKTFVILNGGTTNEGIRGVYGKKPEQGSMQLLCKSLREMGKKFTTFCEPDLNNALTALCFLADERVYDYEKYPDFSTYLKDIGATTEELLRVSLGEVPTALYIKWKREVLGGELNYQLRELLKGKKLA